MNDLEQEVMEAIDRVCALGCDLVSDYIVALQRGETRSEYRALGQAQRESLLKELQDIMAVYEEQPDS